MTAAKPTRTYLVDMPRAEARHLAGTGHTWPATPQQRLAAALREWLAGLSRRRSATIEVRKVITDLTVILESVPPPQAPLHGPFGPGRYTPPLPGRIDYLGGGTIRLDENALNSLAALTPSDDYHITHTDAGPLLTIGTGTYLARVEEPGPKPD